VLKRKIVNPAISLCFSAAPDEPCSKRPIPVPGCFAIKTRNNAVYQCNLALLKCRTAFDKCNIAIHSIVSAENYALISRTGRTLFGSGMTGPGAAKNF